MAYTLAESYLYAWNRSRNACCNEGFFKQAILGSKRLTEERVGRRIRTLAWHVIDMIELPDA